MVDSACPQRDVIVDFLSGLLAPPQANAVADHLIECNACQFAASFLTGEPDPFLTALRECVESELLAAEPELNDALARLLSHPTEPRSSDERGLAPAPNLVGTWIRDYRLLGKLGQGGMGTVYEANHMRLGKPVAIKILSPRHGCPLRAVARFEREMRALGGINHPSIVAAIDAGECAGSVFLVMELVRGVDLATLLDRVGPLSVPDACEIGRQIAEALVYLQASGIVHRDLKPSNLMLESKEGRVKILDLGLARLDDDSLGRELTDGEHALGTADYMAPEQAKNSREVDFRADLYSLGCTLYALLVGKPPYSNPIPRSRLEKILAHLGEPIPDLRAQRQDIPDALCSVVHGLLEKLPSERLSDPAHIAERLSRLSRGANLIELLGSSASIVHERSGMEASNLSPPRVRVGARGGRGSALSASRVGARRFERIWALLSLLLLGLMWIGWESWQANFHSSHAANSSPALPGALQPESLPGDSPLSSLTRSVQADHSEISESPKSEVDGPLSDLAFVSRPPPLPGLLSWTIDTRRHRYGVRAIAAAPDGSWVATAGEDGNIRRWSSDRLELLAMAVGHSQAIEALACSDDGRYLASADAAGECRVWQVESGRCLRTLKHGRRISDLSWSSVGHRLAFCANGRAFVWNLEGEGAPDVTELPSDREVRRLAWRPVVGSRRDGDDAFHQIALATDGGLRVVDVLAGGTFWTIGSVRPIEALAWTKDGLSLAWATAAPTELFVSLAEGTTQPRSIPLGAADRVDALAVSRDLDYLAANLQIADGTSIRVWALGDPAAPFQEHRHGGEPHGICWLGRTHVIASGGRDPSLVLLDRSTGTARRSLPPVGRDLLSQVSWSDDGKQLAIASASNKPGITIDALTGAELPWRFAGRRVAWSRDSQWLAAGGGAPSQLVVRSVDGRVRWARGFSDEITAVAWSPNEDLLAVAAGTKLFLLQGDLPENPRTLHGLDFRASQLVWSSDGRFLAARESTGDPRERDSSYDSSSYLAGPRTPAKAAIKVWDVSRHEEIVGIESPSEVKSIEYSPSLPRLAALSSEEVRFFDMPGNLAASPTVPFSNGEAMAWSPDGSAVTVLRNSARGLWKRIPLASTTGDWTGLATSPNPVLMARYSRDGGKLLVAADRGVIQLHDAATRRILGTVLLISIDDNELRYATIGNSGHCRLFAVGDDEFIYVARTANGQELFTPRGFARRFGWQNEPHRVRLSD